MYSFWFVGMFFFPVETFKNDGPFFLENPFPIEKFKFLSKVKFNL